MGSGESNRSVMETQVGGTHYVSMPIQPWDVIDTWSLEERIGFYRGTVLAYVMRAGSKGDQLEDFQKAQHTLAKLIAELEDDYDLYV